MQKEPSIKLRVVVSDAVLGTSIESSCPGFGKITDEPIALTMVTSGGDETIAYTKKPAAAEVLNILGKASRLHVCPAAILRLAGMIGDPTVSPTEIEKVIKKDPAVAKRTINLANSGYFILPRQIYFLREVLVFLGYMHVRNLAMLAGTQPIFNSDSAFKDSRREKLWRHSVDVAILSRKIAEHMGIMERTSVGGEQAFTAGLLHDIGKLAFDMAMHKEYTAAVREVERVGAPFIEIESNHLPFGHGVLGEALAQQWNLPAVIADAIAYHHEPGNAQLHPELAATVCLADELSYAINTINDVGGVSLDVFDALNPAACAVLGLQRREVQGLVDVCRAEMVTAKALHDVV